MSMTGTLNHEVLRMLILIPKQNLSVSDIKVLRILTGESISSIKSSAEDQTPIKKYPFFETDWEDIRLELKKLVNDWNRREAPFILKDDEFPDLKCISISDLRNMLKGARSIELEQEKASDLELGYIVNEEEFEPHEDDWI
jgi:hypothetical protein